MLRDNQVQLAMIVLRPFEVFGELRETKIKLHQMWLLFIQRAKTLADEVMHPFDVEAISCRIPGSLNPGPVEVAIGRHKYFQMNLLRRYDGVLVGSITQKSGVLLGEVKDQRVLEQFQSSK